MVDRRDFLRITLGAGASLALAPDLLRALQQPAGTLIQRAIPSSGELLPVIGLHRAVVPPSLDRAALKEVIRTLVDHGGRVIDTVHGGDPAEEIAGTIASELGAQRRIFWSTRMAPAGARVPGAPPPKADGAVARAQIDASFARLKVPTIDLIQVLQTLSDVPTHLAVLEELKKAGRVRYVGVSVISDFQYAELESIMRNEPIDFIGVDYAVDNRGVEETILPLAQERKIGVLTFFPFGTRNLFRRAGTTPLPEWAAEFDARTWAQFFLKYVVGHPAVTVVRPGTSQPRHMLENLGGGIGRLPSEATRQRMAQLVDSWPPAARAGG
jgi:aryl-alcohol dehydrogenase-like predicted oxidoreductase